MPFAASLGAGLLLGLAGPVAGKWNNPACVALGVVFTGGWSWVCYAFLVGYFRRSKIESALLSSLGLAFGVVAYYLFKDLSPAVPVGLESGTSGENLSTRILVWGIAAFALGAPVGLLGNLARVPGIGGLPFRLIIPLVAIFETSMRLTTEGDGQGAVVGVTWNVTRFVAGAVALVLVGHTIWSWWHARRMRSSKADEHGAGGGIRATPPV
ncbi:hypothetical protein [Streptomyces sp. NPDC059788]|uniref:hypothetical protein n=1 Tax=Streptomyces sp. NPDC059788 TaxID=3346948 RepID=UPI0036531D53